MEIGGARLHPLTGREISWSRWLQLGLDDQEMERLRAATSTGRPCGSEAFARSLEEALERPLIPEKIRIQPSYFRVQTS